MSSINEDIVIALYDYHANDIEELTIRKNEQLTLLDGSGAWYKVRNKVMQVGLVPSNYVKSKGESLVNRIANRLPGTKKSKMPPGNNFNSGALSNYPASINNPDGDNFGRKIPGDKASLEKYIAKYSYSSTQPDELSLVKGITINVITKEDDGWWQGKDPDGKTGWFPSNYVEMVTDSSTLESSNTALSAPGSNEAKPVLEVVRALYPFNSGQPEELPFEVGDMFDILGKPTSDPEWYEARGADGKTGLVPRNYVEIVPGAQSVFMPESSNYDDVTPEMLGHSKSFNQNSGSGGRGDSMMDKPWYFGPVKRVEAERMLNMRAKNSEFIVRDSESTQGDLSVSMKAPDRIKHFKVSKRDGKYCIGQRKFDSVEDLIDHYRRAPIYTAPEVGKIYLTQPMPK